MSGKALFSKNDFSENKVNYRKNVRTVICNLMIIGICALLISAIIFSITYGKES